MKDMILLYLIYKMWMMKMKLYHAKPFIFIVSDFKRVEDKDFKLDRMFFLKLTEAKVSNLFL
ncbi:hypothetical protein [Myroides odoratimimus]|uniref:Uncharacterized protein n=1 Tax=Myroides odoratimimus TaxID=76832 RepID=A0AAI8C9I1_9FLAO|nr:hypothetical protein [Myroides odoratimimus]ALU28421.1 hypothetical protein AS202_19770 [Myroides odoratimimus]